ncbi:MAG: mannose-1-phosphate guanylyltransferase [Candidatus Berkelbacteria bacterium Licking1014_2]|uniref:Mannose-1-phosphate guanylyltransferase n=1 Tax=Candidatus Berkelbacteria bacterium Licking1014_2 TaxID=2017146 RepID=A0A554LW79_9BACT|nr:MAG: mannose-1-phosphate guanylyltransferase [Candidatus Berkelbacteria bacterium Licking1014_2]
MEGFTTNIEQATAENENFRQVLYTGKHVQLVVMTLKEGEDIGEEVHNNVDQFFRIEVGEAKAVIDGVEHPLTASDVAIVPAGAKHNVINTGSDALRLYTLYSPPNHKDGTIHATKQDAAAAEEHFNSIDFPFHL